MTTYCKLFWNTCLSLQDRDYCMFFNIIQWMLFIYSLVWHLIQLFSSFRALMGGSSKHPKWAFSSTETLLKTAWPCLSAIYTNTFKNLMSRYQDLTSTRPTDLLGVLQHLLHLSLGLKKETARYWLTAFAFIEFITRRTIDLTSILHHYFSFKRPNFSLNQSLAGIVQLSLASSCSNLSIKNK